MHRTANLHGMDDTAILLLIFWIAPRSCVPAMGRFRFSTAATPSMIRSRHILLASALALGLAAVAQAAPSAAPTPAASASAAPSAATPAAAPSPGSAPTAGETRATLISYLGQIIGWYRSTGGELAVRDSSEIVFASDNRQLAQEVLRLAFEYARAQAALLKFSGAGTQAKPSSDRAALDARRALAQAEVDGLADKVRQLKARLKQGRPQSRNLIGRELAAAQGQLDLAQSHVDSIDALIDYQTGGGAGDTSHNSLSAQIDELAGSSLPRDSGTGAAAATPAAPLAIQSVPPGAGFIARSELLMALQREREAIDDALHLTAEVTLAAAARRDRIVEGLRRIDEQSVIEAREASSSDIATVRETRAVFGQLTASRKLLSDALQPLARQIAALNLYAGNLRQWRTVVSRRARGEVFNVAFRLAALAFLFAIVAATAMVWRKLAFRFAPDLHRRHQLMQLRRLALAVGVVIIVLFAMGGDLRVFATVMGFAAAGVALALQNVILSFAGYFYISGRFGIRVGDRVQLAGVTGDVLEIGLFKLAMMELTNETNGRQPTGRVVIFPNSIVFQPNGNFFNQLPGAHYLWNELRLTLAPDCDYRLAEQRVMEVVGAVFARFRDAVQRDYHNLESGLNLRFETPRPFSRLQLSDTGLEIAVRYPVPLQASALAVDEISRRLIDAINREPGLCLVPRSDPALRRAAPSVENPAPPDRSAAAGDTSRINLAPAAAPAPPESPDN